MWTYTQPIKIILSNVLQSRQSSDAAINMKLPTYTTDVDNSLYLSPSRMESYITFGCMMKYRNCVLFQSVEWKTQFFFSSEFGFENWIRKKNMKKTSSKNNLSNYYLHCFVPLWIFILLCFRYCKKPKQRFEMFSVQTA